MSEAAATPANKKLAVVLFNLGGPAGPRDVRPFLRNLFSDPAIIGLPAIFRLPLAGLISTLREQSAKANYARMGGGSPLLKGTEDQAASLCTALSAALPGYETRAFIAMRYWHPTTEEAAEAVAAWAPDEIVLLPLYPQYSTTTTGSSLTEWNQEYRGPGRVHTVCCYPQSPGLIEAHAAAIRGAFEAQGSPENVRLLFSAHGLPESVVAGGDPYQSHVEATARAVVEKLGPGWDWRICYQSRVGPMKWLGPSTQEAVLEAAEEGFGVIVTPIAFVSEHIETLVELDHDYAVVAQNGGCPLYIRVPALGVARAFIDDLAHLVVQALERPQRLCPEGAACEHKFSRCPYLAHRSAA